MYVCVTGGLAVSKFRESIPPSTCLKLNAMNNAEVILNVKVRLGAHRRLVDSSSSR